MRHRIAVSAVVLALAAASTWAEDLYPPIWRGAPGTQTVVWEFLNDPGQYPAAPGGLFLPYDSWTHSASIVGNPTLYHIPGPGAPGWTPKQPTAANPGSTGVKYDPAGAPGDGWINLSGDVYIHLGDVPEPNPKKTIWLQVVWEPQSQTNFPLVTYGTDNNIDQFSAGILADHVLWVAGGTDPLYPWREVHLTEYHFDLFPNPNSENIHITNGVNIDEIVLDTWCQIPEPATLTLLGLAVAPMVWRRIRRR